MQRLIHLMVGLLLALALLPAILISLATSVGRLLTPIVSLLYSILRERRIGR